MHEESVMHARYRKLIPVPVSLYAIPTTTGQIRLGRTAPIFN